MLKSNGNILGIDIGTGLIKMAQVLQEGDMRLVKWGCIETPDAEEVHNGNAGAREAGIAKAIKECYRQNGFSTRAASLCISDPSVISRDIKLPEMKDEEIRENIKFEMQEYFSIDPEKYSVTYKILKRDENEGRAVLRVLGVAAPLDLLAGYVRTLKKAGLKLQYIDISINAYLKVFKLLTETEALALSKGVCLLDYGYSTLTMSVFDGGIPFVTRALDKTWEDDNIDEVAARLNQVLDYYYSRNYTSRIEKVWVVGGNSIADDFCSYLSLQTGSEVKPLAPEMLNIRYCDGQTAIPIALYAKSIGAAIREDVRK